jgi:hypothetical protein
MTGWSSRPTTESWQAAPDVEETVLDGGAHDGAEQSMDLRHDVVANRFAVALTIEFTGRTVPISVLVVFSTPVFHASNLMMDVR